MKTATSIRYDYDPKIGWLVVTVNGKMAGGFSGTAADKQLARLLGTEVEIHISDMSVKFKSDKVRKLRALWIKQGVDHMRDAILQPYGVSSTSDLTMEQLTELIARFSIENNQPASERVRHLRSDVLVVLNKLGVYVTNNDWTMVNNYLMQPRIAGKVLYQMNEEELQELRKKLNSILRKQEVETDRVTRLTQMN